MNVKSVCALLYLAGAMAGEPVAGLRNEEATQSLRREGVYESLREAVANAQYRIEEQNGVWRASNAAQRLTAEFGRESVTLRHPDGVFTLRLATWGSERHLRDAEAGTRAASGRRLEYRRDGMTEWWVNDARGIQQGFTIVERPGPSGTAGVLVLGLEFGGDLTPAPADGSISLRKRGQEVLSYAGLKAWDVRGKTLPSRMKMVGRQVRLVVDDAAAVYPVTVDPWVQQAKLTASDGVGPDCFGNAVAISGNTVLVGASNSSQQVGSAYVFVRDGNSWAQQAKLTYSMDSGRFGEAVALSGDDAAIGAPSLHSGKGSVLVFRRNGTAWKFYTEVYGGTRGSNFGRAIALSGDTLLIGDTMDDDKGAVHVYVRDGSIWSQQAKLTASDGVTGDTFGASVALSGETALVASEKKAYVFVRSGTTWMEQAKLAPKLTYFDSQNIALSGDTALVVASSDTGRLVLVYVRSGATWVLQARLTSPIPEIIWFMGPIALSGDTALVRAITFGAEHRWVYVFIRRGTIWTQQAKFTGPVDYPWDEFGNAVALDGGTAVVGAYGTDAYRGATYLYALTPPPCTLNMSLSYAPKILNIGFTIRTTQPSRWTGYLVRAKGVLQLWNREFPGPVKPPFTGTIPLPLPPQGNVGVLSTIFTGEGRLTCGEFAIVNTGGAGPTVGELRNIAERNGLRLP